MYVRDQGVEDTSDMEVMLLVSGAVGILVCVCVAAAIYRFKNNNNNKHARTKVLLPQEVELNTMNSNHIQHE